MAVARGLSDLDIAFVLPYATYQQYNSYTGNGQSALLQAVKRSIQKTYKTSDSFGDGQVVVINFDDNLTFEVLPVFENKDSISWTFPNANDGGSWKVCNPKAEIAAIKERNDAAMLRTALTDFRGCDECRNIMQEPFERAIQWLEAKEDNEQRLLSYNVS